MNRRVLILYWNPSRRPLRSAIDQHLHTFDHIDGVEPIYFNAAWGAPEWLLQAGFDAVVLHTTLLCIRWAPWFAGAKSNLSWIARFEGPVLALPQDEYDHSEVLDEWLGELGVDAVFSNFAGQARADIYLTLSGRCQFFKVYTGYVDSAWLARSRTTTLPLPERPKDLAYRATNLPYWFGSHGQLKSVLAERFLPEASRAGLISDISTKPEDVIVGESWFDFLASARAVLGCESGSSALDRRGEIRESVQDILRQEPDAGFNHVSSRLPSGWDDYQFFALSPRHFEASLTRTCQVLVRGEYEGVLVPHRHYIPVDRDFSNLLDVVEQLKDVSLLSKIAAASFEEVALNPAYHYDAFAAQISDVLHEEMRRSPVDARPSTTLQTRLRLSEWRGHARYLWHTKPPLRSIPEKLMRLTRRRRRPSR